MSYITSITGWARQGMGDEERVSKSSSKMKYVRVMERICIAA